MMASSRISADLGRMPLSWVAADHAPMSPPISPSLADAQRTLHRASQRGRGQQQLLRASAVQEVQLYPSCHCWRMRAPTGGCVTFREISSTVVLCVQAEAPSWGPVTELWTKKSKTDYDSLQARFRAADIDG